MIVEIPTNPNDDPQFVEFVSHVIANSVDDNFPKEIFVIQVNNWFDLKWLNFSGIGRVGFFWTLSPDTVLDEFRQDKITFPPFSPARIVEEHFFSRDERGNYSASTAAPFIHPIKRASSCENLHRRVADFADSAIFVWFSSNTKSNGRGSLMVYEVRDSTVHTWYAAFSRKEEWRVLQVNGITREQVKALMQPEMIRRHL